jgi:hypothetical protein
LSLTRFFLQIYYLRLMQVAYLLRNLNSLVWLMALVTMLE